MLIALPTIIIVSLVRIFIETPVPNNTKTLYCTADVSYKNGEQEIGSKKNCVRGSMRVKDSKLSLAERKSK